MAGRQEALERGKAKADKASQERTGKDGKKGKKGKKGGKTGAGGASVRSHPRARQSVRRAKGFGGLGGFALAALLSHQAGLDLAGLLGRALVVGIVGYVLAGACAVSVWRHLVLAELRVAYEALHAGEPESAGDRAAAPAPSELAEPVPRAAAR